MKLLHVKITAFILMAGLLSACGAQATASPPSASQPTGAAAPANPTITTAPPATDPATATQPAAQGATVGFAKDVLPILESRCTNCHGGSRTEKGLNITTYNNLLAGSENGPVVTPGNAADSRLVELITNGKMPKRGPKLTPSQVQLITDWVSQGALNN